MMSFRGRQAERILGRATQERSPPDVGVYDTLAGSNDHVDIGCVRSRAVLIGLRRERPVVATEGGANRHAGTPAVQLKQGASSALSPHRRTLRAGRCARARPATAMNNACPWHVPSPGYPSVEFVLTVQATARTRNRELKRRPLTGAPILAGSRLAAATLCSQRA